MENYSRNYIKDFITFLSTLFRDEREVEEEEESEEPLTEQELRARVSRAMRANPQLLLGTPKVDASGGGTGANAKHGAGGGADKKRKNNAAATRAK